MGNALMNEKKRIAQLSVAAIEQYNSPLCEGWNGPEDCVKCSLDCPNSTSFQKQAEVCDGKEING